MRWQSLIPLAVVALVACGGPPAPARGADLSQALTQSPETLELEPLAVRQTLFRDLERTAQTEAGGASLGPVLFPFIHNGELKAAPALESADLFTAPDAGESLTLLFDDEDGASWPADRRDGLLGLSERDAAELVARTLLSGWGVHSGAIKVERAAGAPYAAAFADGVLRINPALLYLAAAASGR